MDLMTTIAAVLVTLVSLFYGWLLYSDWVARTEFAKRKLKYVKLGNAFKALYLREQVHLTKTEAVKREGPVFGFSFLNKYTVMVADADIVQTILVKSFTDFANRREFPAFDKVMSENIAVVSDEKWKRLRSIITPAFSVGKLKQMKPCMDKTVQTLLQNINKKLTESSTHNVKGIFDCFTIDTIIQTAFGVTVDSLNEPNNPIIVNGRKMFQSSPKLLDLIKMSMLFMMPKLAKLLHIEVTDEGTTFFTKLSVDIMNQKREEFATQKDGFSKATSFIEFMIIAEQEGKKMEAAEEENDQKKPTKYMTPDEVVSQCVVFFLAGFETTATLLSVTAFHLAQNPAIQERLYEETVAVIEKLKAESPDEPDIYKLITYEAIQTRFEYLNAVINETLRIDSPGIFLERTASKDIELTNGDGSVSVSLKEGDIVHVPVWTMHRDEKYFPEPERFKPERFLSSSLSEPTFNKNAYNPFGTGPRACVARLMALMEARMAMLHLVRCYRFELCPQTQIPLDFTVQFDLITPKEVNLKIVKR